MAYKKNLKKLQQAIIKLEQTKPQTNVETNTGNTSVSRP
jgi:hypothetical protein